MEIIEVTHKVQLVNGEFTAQEATEIVNALINEKLSFHRLHRLTMNEANRNCDTSQDDTRVNELKKEKEDFKAISQEALAAGRKLRISGVLKVDIIE